MIFVFGSNLKGVHGKGAALYAYQNHGAIAGKGIGRQGNAYAIPTKDERLRPLGLNQIEYYVKNFIEYAENHPELQFNITRIGCGLAGYSDEQIIPFFELAPINCHLPGEWKLGQVDLWPNDNKSSVV